MEKTIPVDLANGRSGRVWTVFVLGLYCIMVGSVHFDYIMIRLGSSLFGYV